VRTPPPLRHRDFRWLFTGRTVSHFGNAVAPIALAYAVLDLTGSLTALGLVVAARSIANVTLLLLGGVLADRWPRALVLTGAQLAAALTQAAVAALVLTGSATVPLLVVLSVLNGAAAAIAFPATASLLPQTVPGHLLQQANALSRLGLNTALIGGAAAAGALVALVGPGWGLALDAACFALAAACFSRITGVPRPVPERTSPLRDLRDGWTEFTSRRWVWVVVAQFCVVNAAWVGGTAVLGPAVADASIGRAGWGLASAATGAGLAAGAVIAMAWQPRRALATGVLACLLLCAPLLALSRGPSLALLLPAMFAAGLALEQFGIAWDVSLQENVPPDRLARVYSYDALGSYLAIPLGEIAVGPLAERIGLAPTLLGCATLVLLATLVALSSRDVRQLHRRPASAGGR